MFDKADATSTQRSKFVCLKCICESELMEKYTVWKIFLAQHDNVHFMIIKCTKFMEFIIWLAFL